MTEGARYAAGALLAVGAGAIFNLGVLVQKRAVNATAGGGALMPRLLRSPTWLAGVAIQFLLGTPLYAAAQLSIGPTLIPGLMATGLVVLALGSPLVVGERVVPSDWAAVGLIVAAVALFGASGLSVDLGGLELHRGTLLYRLAGITALAGAIALALLGAAGAASARGARPGALLSLASGLLYALGNLWLGAFMATAERVASGEREGGLVVFGLAGLALVAIANILSMAWLQRAFRHGKAAALVPLQQAPIQILPAVSYFAVFLQTPPRPSSPYLAASGIVLVLAGSALLGRGGGANSPSDPARRDAPRASG